MSANELVDAIVAHIAAEETQEAFLKFMLLRSDPTGLDDAHKIALADVMMSPIWLSKPPRSEPEPPE